MALSSLLPGELKSPVIIIIALVLLAASLCGAWIFLRRSGGHQVTNHPSNVTQETDTVDIRAAWSI